MKRFLIVVDMQKDFVDGSLGTAEAVAIVPGVVKKINSFEGEIIATRDTHFENYMDTREGKKLPVPHCIKGTPGWELNCDVKAALEAKPFTYVDKFSFGSTALPGIITSLAGTDDFEIELCGLCTDICVVSNALFLKACFSEKEITVDASCCAGVTPDTHKAALDTMRMCQINIVNE